MIPVMAQNPILRRGQRLAGAERDQIGRDLLRRYQSGRSIREICQETGYSIGRVRRLLIEQGVQFRGRGGATRAGSSTARKVTKRSKS
jgi:hypothetical protein